MSNQLYENLQGFNSKLVNFNTLKTFHLFFFFFNLGFQKHWRFNAASLSSVVTFHDDLSEDYFKWWSFDIQFRYVKEATFQQKFVLRKHEIMKSSLTSFLLSVVFLLFFCAVQLVQFELDKHE